MRGIKRFAIILFLLITAGAAYGSVVYINAPLKKAEVFMVGDMIKAEHDFIASEPDTYRYLPYRNKHLFARAGAFAHQANKRTY